jgi:peptidoglycan/LPS O-acetylase OafA/YrhL
VFKCGGQRPKAASLGDLFDARRNAFGFLRFALASLVIFSHCYSVGGFGFDPLETLSSQRLSLGILAVAMFFILSGFLITRSALQAPSVGRFLWHRFLRIFPGYWVCLIFCAFMMAPLIFQLEYGHALRIFSMSPLSPQSFVAGNFAILHFRSLSIAGVVNVMPWSIGLIMSHNPCRWIVNGSLWTLPYELICYLGVAGFAALQILRRARGIVFSVFVISWAMHILACCSPQLFHDCFPQRAMSALVMFCLYFSAGSVCYLYRERIRFSRGLVCGACCLLAGDLCAGYFGIIAPVALPYVFLWLACKLPIRHFDARADYSYGLYIYAFPLQQTLVFLHVHLIGFAGLFACTFLLSLSFAIASYWFVEAPCLRWKNVSPRDLIRGLAKEKEPAVASHPVAAAAPR